MRALFTLHFRNIFHIFLKNRGKNMRITWMGTTFTTYKHIYAALIRRGVVGDAIDNLNQNTARP